MLDFDRINTSTRRASSGESFPWNCVEFAAAGWTGVWAWQPTAASARENVRARRDARSGFTTVNTILRLSHAEPIFPLSGAASDVAGRRLKQARRASQISRRPNIHQREAEFLLPLIPYRTELILAILDAEPATVPVI